MSTVAVGWSPEFRNHRVDSAHPERPSRCEAVGALLTRLAGRVERYPFEPASDGQIEAIHHPRYHAELRATRGVQQPVVFDSDTSAWADTYDVARLAAGAAAAGVDWVLGGGPGRRAFSLARPPGHHAEVDRAMGYCFFNNVAIAAQHSIDAHGLRRVAIVDWDVHHGNGTHACFDGRDDVLFASTHQYKLFPGTGHYSRQGRGRGLGYTLSLPLSHDAGDEDILWLYRSLVLPVLESFRPELLLISAGFDAHELDRTAEQRITSQGFGRLGALLFDAADRLCDGRAVVVLEGGYSLPGLASGLECTLEAARDPEPILRRALPPPHPHLEMTIDSLKRVHRPYWGCLAEGSDAAAAAAPIAAPA